MSYATVSEQPMEVAVGFDYMVQKYGRDHNSAAQNIYEKHRDALIRRVYGIKEE